MKPPKNLSYIVRVVDSEPFLGAGVSYQSQPCAGWRAVCVVENQIKRNAPLDCIEIWVWCSILVERLDDMEIAGGVWRRVADGDRWGELIDESERGSVDVRFTEESNNAEVDQIVMGEIKDSRISDAKVLSLFDMRRRNPVC